MGLSEYLESRDRDLSVHAPLLNLGDESAFESNVRVLIAMLERAGAYGAKNIVLHTGILSGRDASVGIEIATSVIDSILEMLEMHDLVLCLENVGYLGDDLISDYKQLASLVDSFPRHLVGVAFDFSHANITGGVESGIKILGDRVNHAVGSAARRDAGVPAFVAISFLSRYAADRWEICFH